MDDTERPTASNASFSNTWGETDALGFQEMSAQAVVPSDDNDYSEIESSIYDAGDNFVRTDG